MFNVITRARVAAMLALAATTLCVAFAVPASAGTPIREKYCVNWETEACRTDKENLPNWTYYTRVEMQGYHCAALYDYFHSECGTANYVYSECELTEGNPKWASGYNVAGVRRNLQVILFHATSTSDCELHRNNG